MSMAFPHLCLPNHEIIGDKNDGAVLTIQAGLFVGDNIKFIYFGACVFIKKFSEATVKSLI